MAIRVLVIGQHSPVQDMFEDVADRGRIGPDTDTFMMLRCSTPGALFDTVRSAVRKLNAPISVLDLYDHGGDGYLRMGDPIEPPLFAAEGVGADLAKSLADLLTHDAQVRLLGCDTAVAADGKSLLLMLRDAFKKSIVVQGTLKAVVPGDFGVGGFKMAREEQYLFSSTEAAELPKGQVAPTYDDRTIALHSWRVAVG